MSYITTYSGSYRKKPITYVKPAIQTHEEFDELPEGVKWRTAKIDVKSSLGEALDKIKEMYAQRMVSVYRKEYPWKTREMGPVQEDAETKDMMLTTCEHIKFGRKDFERLPPLPGARNLYGYMNPKYFLTEHTTYEMHYGVPACEWMFGKNLDQPRGEGAKKKKTTGGTTKTQDSAKANGTCKCQPHNSNGLDGMKIVGN